MARLAPSCLVAVAVLVAPPRTHPAPTRPADADAPGGFAQAFPEFGKGGIGIVTRDLHVVLASERNELALSRGDRWTGLDRGLRQVVIVFRGSVVDPAAPPPDFDLASATIVSFEGDVVKFIEAGTGERLFYRRAAARPRVEPR